MRRFTKLALLLCFTPLGSAIAHTASAATLDDQFAARLDALEKENAALRARVNHLEASKAARTERRSAVPNPDACRGAAAGRCGSLGHHA